MKIILLITLFLFNLSLYSQSFNGNYTSNKTSFKDDLKSENNFVEKTKFNIAIIIKDDATDGRVVIQDPRIANTLLIYKISKRKDYIELNNRWIAIYDCIADHLDTQDKATLTFYISEEDKLNFLVSDNNSSQMFFDLKI